MPFAVCQFSDTDGVDLNAHNPATIPCSPHSGAGAWIRNGAHSANVLQFVSNRIRLATSNVRGVYYKNDAPADADYSVFAVIRAVSLVATSRAAALGRLDTTADTMYQARYDGANWGLAKRVAGTQTVLGTPVAATLTITQEYTVELRMVGTAISMRVDGVLIDSVTDASISATGFAGVLLNAVSPSDTTDLQITSFHADDTPGGDPSGSTIIGRLGARATDDATKTTSNTVIGRLGVRSTNVASLASQGSATIARLGVRSVNDAGKASTSLIVGGLGARSINTAGVTHSLDHVGRLGIRSTMTMVVPTGGTIGRLGARATNSTTMTRNVTHVARLGLRAANDTTRVTTTSIVGRVGVRSVGVASRTMTVNTVGRIGGRARNTYTTGALPPPTVALAANNNECAADWTLAPSVTWPDPSTLTGCVIPAGSFTE